MKLLYHDCAHITGHCEACPGGPCLRINVAYAMRNTEAAASWSLSLFVVLINDGINDVCILRGSLSNCPTFAHNLSLHCRHCSLFRCEFQGQSV